jgi:hypothetical protein
MERENLCFVTSEDVKGQAASGSNREGESTEAGRRGGAARSIVEGPVMGLERRGCVVRPWPLANWNQERSKAVQATVEADDHLLTVDVARPQPHHLARPQSATIGECQHRSRRQAGRHDQNMPDPRGAQHGRQLLRFLDVPDLSRHIVATQCHTEQKPHPGHDPVAVADACSALDEVELETPHLVGRRCSGERFSQAANRLQLEMWPR